MSGMTLTLPLFRRRKLPLPAFNLAPLAFEMAEAEDELLLDRVVSRPGNSPGVVALGAPMPTPGQLQASIERHLREAKRASEDAPQDARDELRNALAELRRSIG